MEENVALDTSKQKQFVKGIKKLLKKNLKDEPGKAFSLKTKDKKISKRKRKERGLVYLSHIPHGFYEHEMTQYFKQFGVVTNARVIRSRRTGNSKGYAFVEFRQPAVAEIVAETMNNYLMGKRLIKAAYIPPEKQRPSAMRKNWSSNFNPGREMRLKMKKAYNSNKDGEGEMKRVKKLLSNIRKTKKRLSEIGITYDFQPVDFPENFKNIKNEKEESNKTEIKEEKKSKKKNKKDLKSKDNAEIFTVDIKEKVDVKKSKLEQDKKVKDEKKSNKKEQTQKQKKLKEAGVTPPENFIKIQQEDGDSDSSYEFDSDEYEKMLENEDELNSDISGDDGEEIDDESDDEVTDNEESNEESEIEVPPKKAKRKSVLIVSKPVQVLAKPVQVLAKPVQVLAKPVQVLAKPVQVLAKPVQVKKQKNLNSKKLPKALPEEIKRKVPQKAAVSPKKQKFEKQSQKPIKKQFKKKK